MSEQRPEPGRHTTLAPGDRVRHWSEGYLASVRSIQPMDEPLPDYCMIELEGSGTIINVPHNQLVKLPSAAEEALVRFLACEPSAPRAS